MVLIISNGQDRIIQIRLLRLLNHIMESQLQVMNYMKMRMEKF